MNANDFNKREVEQGRLTWDQLAVLCSYGDVAHLKDNVRKGVLSWPKISQVVEDFQRQEHLTPDGMAGEQTRVHIHLAAPAEIVRTQVTTIKALPIAPEATTGKWAWFDGPALRQPKNRHEVLEMFGDPGTKCENRAWTKKNTIDCHHTLGNALPGVPAHFWITVHRVVEPYVREALWRIQVSCPGFVIEVLGSHNWRPIRHKIGNPLSMHAWAIALDFTSHINLGIDFPKGHSPQLWTEEFYKHWPKEDPRTMTPSVVDCLSSCGFANGSDWDEDGLSTDQSFLDLMHEEWVDRGGQGTHV